MPQSRTFSPSLPQASPSLHFRLVSKLHPSSQAHNSNSNQEHTGSCSQGTSQSLWILRLLSIPVRTLLPPEPGLNNPTSPQGSGVRKQLVSILDSLFLGNSAAPHDARALSEGAGWDPCLWKNTALKGAQSTFPSTFMWLLAPLPPAPRSLLERQWKYLGFALEQGSNAPRYDSKWACTAWQQKSYSAWACS